MLKQKNFPEALQFFEQVLAQAIKLQGENSKMALAVQNSIALVYTELGELEKALSLFEQVEKKQLEILGPDHSDILTTKFNRATVLFDMEQFQQASIIFKDVYEKQKEMLGEVHLQTMTTLGWIAGTVEQEGKLTDALNMHKKLYESNKELFGEKFFITREIQHNIKLLEEKIEKGVMTICIKIDRERVGKFKKGRKNRTKLKAWISEVKYVKVDDKSKK